MTQCPQCGLRFPETGPGTANNGPECPNCGHKIAPSDRMGSGNRPADYLRDAKEILLRPSRFFRDLPLRGGLSRPLSFALIAHWIGTALAYLWIALTGSALTHLFNHVQFNESTTFIDSPARFSMWLQTKQKMAQWFMAWFLGTGSIILDPFKTLVGILFTSLFVYAGARLFVNSEKQSEVSYESAVRLVAYGMTPAIIAVFPFLGGFAAALYVLVVTIIGAREMYRISNGRALLVALFPKLLFLGIIALGAFAFFFAALKFLLTAIHFQ